MEVYSCGNRKLFTLDSAYVMTLVTSTKIFPNCMCFMPFSDILNKVQDHYKWIISNWAFHAQAHFQMDYKRNQANNPRKRNSPLNMRVKDISVEVPFELFEELVCYLLRVNRFFFLYSLFMSNKTLHVMHTCQASF